jgi:hypothetical protein
LSGIYYRSFTEAFKKEVVFERICSGFTSPRRKLLKHEIKQRKRVLLCNEKY